MLYKMARVLCLTVVASLVFAGCSGQEPADNDPVEDVAGTEAVPQEFDSEAAKASYAYGRMQGEMMKQQGLNLEAMEWGLKDVKDEVEPRLTPPEISAAMQELQMAAEPPEPKELKLDEDGLPVLETPMQKLSYVWGMRFAEALAEEESMLELDTMMSGMRHSYDDKARVMTDEEREEAVQPLMEEARKKMMEAQEKEAQARQELGAANLKEGQEFLAENKDAEGVTVTESGLQHKALEAGEGASPEPTDTVRVHYKGTLLDGSTFDSSYERGEPAEFQLNEVIPGWTEGLQLMKEGAKYRFWIPAELGYGERGTPGIPPNAVLIFDVELLEVVEPEEATDDAPDGTMDAE